MRSSWIEVMLLVYKKNRQANLTQDQLRIVSRLMKEWLQWMKKISMKGPAMALLKVAPMNPEAVMDALGS
jgi:hypothetical protein